MIRYLQYIFFAAAAISGCKNAGLTPAQYYEYVKDSANGLKLKKSVGKVSFTVQYKPLAFVCLQELRKPQVSVSDLEALEDQFSGLEYFTFTIESNDNHSDPLKEDLSSDEQYSQRLSYLSFGIQNDFQILDGTDTLKCVIEHFERNYNIAPNADIVLGFTKNDLARVDSSDLRFVFYDRLYGSGINNFVIRREALNKIPNLKTI